MIEFLSFFFFAPAARGPGSMTNQEMPLPATSNPSRYAAPFFSLNQVHHYLQYLADDGHDAMLVSAIAIIPFHAPLDRAPVELWSVNAYCRQLAFWSHQLVQFFFFWTEEFSPHFYAQCAQKYCGPPSLNPGRQCWPLAKLLTNRAFGSFPIS
jgi:hypothetical protein